MTNALSNLFSLDQVMGFTISCAVAVLCGVMIGIERESKGKPAGLRTLVLICLGSTVYVKVSILLSGGFGDPARVSAQIVTGIGFLGAGAILQRTEQGYVAGLTTAASIWVTAAIGMVVGSGHYLIAVVSVGITVVSLRLLHWLEGYLFYENIIEVRRIVFEANYGKTKWALLGHIEENMIDPEEYKFTEVEGGRPCLELRYIPKNRNHRGFLAQVANLPEILEIT
jgi:putative Mg2+ transporter-C (MgtC) family protein